MACSAVELAKEHSNVLDELEQLRAERADLGDAEHQWRIVTPNGPVHSFTQRDLDDRANWLPGVRLERRTVYGTTWEPADDAAQDFNSSGSTQESR